MTRLLQSNSAGRLESGSRQAECSRNSLQVMYVFPKKKPETVTTIEYHLRVKTMALLSKKEKKKSKKIAI